METTRLQKAVGLKCERLFINRFLNAITIAIVKLQSLERRLQMNCETALQYLQVPIY